MPIERKDRSFDIIFDQVSLDHVPAEYILEINIELMDGSSVSMTKEDIIAGDRFKFEHDRDLGDNKFRVKLLDNIDENE